MPLLGTEIEMTVDRWVNLIREHIRTSDATIADVREYVMVLASGPMIIPPVEHGLIIFLNEEQSKSFNDNSEEILSRLEAE